MVIDAHIHLFKEYYPFRYIGLVRDLDRIVERLFGTGKLEQAWVLSGPFLKQEAGDEEVLEACGRYPELLVPFGFLDFRRPPGLIDELRERGAVGLKTIFPPKAYDDESLFPHYERAQALKMPIVFHTGNVGIFPPYVLSEQLDIPSRSTSYHRAQRIETLARHFPDLVLIIGHAGYPAHVEAAEMCDRYPNVYMDISAYPNEHAMRDILATGVDRSKILFGSDYPVEHPLERLYFWEAFFTHSLQLDQREQRMIFGENARALLHRLRG